MNLALFDLDHTLIPFDSGMAWTQFLVRRGVLSADDAATYLAYCHQYVAGTLDIRAMHRASLQPLLRHPRAMLLEDPAWGGGERTLYLGDLQNARSIVVCNSLRGAIPARLAGVPP